MTVPIPALQPVPAGPISPARVVPLTPLTATPAAEVRVCSRCRGACDANAQFCRFCGAPLGTSEPSSRAAPPVAAAPTTDPVPAAASAGRPMVVLAEVPRAPPPAIDRAPVDDLLPRARVVVIAKDGGEGASYAVGEVLDFGRSEGDVIVAEDRYLSPRHARLVRRGERLYLRDLGSTNGLYLRLRPSSSPPGAVGAAGAASSLAPHGNDPSGNAAANASSKTSAVGGITGGYGSPGPSALSLAHPLRDQDLLLVGQQVLRFEVVNDAEEGLGPASQHGTLLFGSPATPRYARLCQRTVEGVIRDVFYIRKAETVLGRESGDVVFAEDPFLSRRHATVRVEKDPRRFLLTDLGSSNGTFVQVRGEIAIESGDQFRIGQQLFRVDIT
jgi:pSer/pThr/pTyr-binding forkhead associated (FHA) protein